MNLSDWLKVNSCDEETHINWAIQLAQLLEKCTDGHLNPERISVDEQEKILSLNDSDIFLDEYSAPEKSKDTSINDFSAAVFSYGLIVEELFLKCDATEEPLENIVKICLDDVQKRPQNFSELKNLLLQNDSVAQYLKNNPDNIWAEKEICDTGLAVGIDFGTSNSTVAYYRDGAAHYPEIDGKYIIPSIIYFRKIEQWLYGERTIERGMNHPYSILRHFKRHIGENNPQIFRAESTSVDPDTFKRKYIIDTDIFIEAPLILETFDADAEILIPKIVYEELTHLKDIKENADEAEIALNSIEENKNIVCIENSHLQFLSDDFFNSSAKNNPKVNEILSIAFFHDNKKTILLSNDKLIEEKSYLQKHKFQVQHYDLFKTYQNIISKDNPAGELKITAKEGAIFFLHYLRNEIQKKLGYVSKAIITVPQEFSPVQRNEIKDAGFKAGFSEVELESEPVAAAVAYGLELNEDKTILVYDFGGGTFDVSILRIADGKFTRVDSGGDDKLGGEDFTQALIDDFKDKLSYGEILQNEESLDMFDEENSGLSHEEFGLNNASIWNACEKLKCALSSGEYEKIILPLYVSDGKIENVQYELSRDDFENITGKLISQSKEILDGILNRAKLQRLDIDVVILAGGTSTIPAIQEMVKQYFGKQPYSNKNPATLIAEGAAVLADIKWNKNSTVKQEIKIFDKTATDFGVSTKGHIFDVLIPSNSPLPAQKEKIYFLVKDEQEELLIEIFTRAEGSTATRITDDSIKYIGKLQISDLPPLKRSEVLVGVTFSLTEKYELTAAVNLQDREGYSINREQVKISIGV